MKLNKAVNKLRKNKAIIDANKIHFELTEVRSGFQNRVYDIKLKPVEIGSVAASDMHAIIAKAYLQALKQLPRHANFTMYSDITLAADLGPVHSATSRYRKKDISEWFQDMINKIYDLVQSAMTIRLSMLKMNFHFAIMPEGSGYLESKTLSEHYKKKSVVRVNNQDNNCFWYSLVNLIYMNHPKKEKNKTR